jgi:putative ATP-dependent endonuclease of OLD family
MHVVHVEIHGFRGVDELRIRFDKQTVIVGPNGCGKTTVADALALALGRDRLVRQLTEHDFNGCDPAATDRIRIVATVAGFPNNNPDQATHWFRDGRAVERWWNADTAQAAPEPGNGANELCAQIGFAARFDRETLEVEQIRYFHDSDTLVDPFADDAVTTFPTQLLTELGFFLVPAKRTWDRLASFESELFRRLIRTTQGIPSEALLQERDRLRAPDAPLETEAPIAPLVNHINGELAKLLPGAPVFRLRVTATDTAGLLEALEPHYQYPDGALLPAGRHGTGLLSLQTLILLLEFGRIRTGANENFILVVEEPELHLPPALQRRALHRAHTVSNQVILTTHSPHVASFFRPSQVCVLETGHPRRTPSRLLEQDLPPNAPNALRKLLLDNRNALLDALMHACVLVPEGRTEYEILRLLTALTESSEGWAVADGTVAFGTVVGVVPTHDAAVKITSETLRRVRDGVVPLVDGDPAGDGYITDLLALVSPPRRVLQLPARWTIEDVLNWIVSADEPNLLAGVGAALDRSFASAAVLLAELKKPTNQGGLKTDYLGYENLIGAFRSSAPALGRVRQFLSDVRVAASEAGDTHPRWTRLPQSTAESVVLRWTP